MVVMKFSFLEEIICKQMIIKITPIPNSSTRHSQKQPSQRRCFGRSPQFLQKIFIKIDGCPLWMRETLYNRRQEEIRERKRLEEEQLLKEKELLEQTQLEENKQPPVQKKLSLFQKVFKKNNN